MLDEYNYDEVESGRSETLVKALDKIEVLEKQLNIAIHCLKRYADEDNWTTFNDNCVFAEIFLDDFDGYSRAQTALEDIENVTK